MTSLGHADTETLAETLGGRDGEDWDPYEQSLLESTVVGDNDSMKIDSDGDSVMTMKKKQWALYQPTAGEPSRPSISRIMRGISSLPLRAFHSVGTLAQRMLALCNADMQVRGILLANAAVMRRQSYKGKGVAGQRMKNMIMDVPKERTIRERIRLIKNSLQAEQDCSHPAYLRIYSGLVELLCTILRAPPQTYDESLLWRAWDILLDELKGKHVDVLVDGLSSPDCADEDVGTILRHLSLARLSGWRMYGALSSTDPVLSTELARRASFSSDTYDNYVALNEGFFALLSGLTWRKPGSVHEALDDYIHLVWFKYSAPLPSRTSTASFSPSVPSADIRFDYLVDNISPTFHPFPKRFDPSLSAEAGSFTQFIGSEGFPFSSSTEKYSGRGRSAAAVGHMSDLLRRLALASTPVPQATITFLDSPECQFAPDFDTEAMYKLFREHPGLASAELAHPALPVLLFLSTLLEDSDQAGPQLVSKETNFLESLSTLWNHSFLLPKDYIQYWTYSGIGPGPGCYVPKEKRTRAMRLATCVFVAALANATVRAQTRDQDPAPMRILVERIIESPVLSAWFRDVAAAAVSFQIHFQQQVQKKRGSVVPLSKEKKREKDVEQMYADVLGHVRHIVHCVNNRRLEIGPSSALDDHATGVENLVWIFEDVSVALPIPAFTTVLMSSTSSPAWISALGILESLSSSNASYFLRFFAHFIPLLIDNKVCGPHRRASRLAVVGSSPRSPSTPRTVECDDSPLFMPHPTDRFLMLLTSAIHRRHFMAEVLRKDDIVLSLLLRLINMVSRGKYRSYEDSSGEQTIVSVDEEQKQWRARTCRDLSLILDRRQATAPGSP